MREGDHSGIQCISCSKYESAFLYFRLMIGLFVLSSYVVSPTLLDAQFSYYLDKIVTLHWFASLLELLALSLGPREMVLVCLSRLQK